jgi:ABC-type transporter Mla subunit MlaD
METVIEKDSPAVPLLILAVAFLFVIGGGLLVLAYMGGVFTGKNEVIANDKRIMDQAALLAPARQ